MYNTHSSGRCLAQGGLSPSLAAPVALLALIAFLFAAAPALAAGGLVITPQLVELDSANRSQVLTLANRGTETETYRISVINYRMDEAGELHLTETPAHGEGFAGAFFRYAPRQITLEPGRPQTVRILYRRAANMQEGEYRSHLLFQQVPKAAPIDPNAGAGGGLSMTIRTLFGISVPVIVRHGRLESQGEITDLVPIKTSDGKPGIALRIARAGQKSLRGDLVAMMGSEEVGRLNNVAVYLSTPHRDVILPLDPEKLSSGPGREVFVEYRERPDKGGSQIASGQLQIR